MKSSPKDLVLLHTIVLLWGSTAVLGKIISIPPSEMIFYRSAFAALGMGLLMLMIKKPFTLYTADVGTISLVGLLIALHWITFFMSGKISNPSTSLIGFATCSFWAAILEPISKKEKPQLIEILFALVVLFGLSIIFFSDFNYPLGLFLGVLSGLFAALFNIINARLVKRYTPYTLTFYEMIACTSTMILFLIGSTWLGETVNLNAHGLDWVYILFLAFACTIFAYAVGINLTKKFSVFYIQLVLNLEPVYGILLAILVFGKSEVMTPSFYLGGFIIVSGVLLYPRAKRYWMNYKNSEAIK